MGNLLTVFIGMIMVPFVFLITFFMDLILAWPLKWTWNYSIPHLFNIPSVSYWQAFSLLIVSTLLLKLNPSTSSNNK